MNQRFMFLLFNHTITDAQIIDARKSLGVEKVIEMPNDLKVIWANIPPELECVCCLSGTGENLACDDGARGGLCADPG
jgi:hypothetical protein